MLSILLFSIWCFRMLDYHGSLRKISISILKWIYNTFNGCTKVYGIIQPFEQKLKVKASEIILKQDARTDMNWCVLLIHMTKIIYQCLMIQAVVMEYQYQLRHLKKHFSNLVTQSTVSIFGFNALKSIIQT